MPKRFLSRSASSDQVVARAALADYLGERATGGMPVLLLALERRLHHLHRDVGRKPFEGRLGSFALPEAEDGAHELRDDQHREDEAEDARERSRHGAGGGGRALRGPSRLPFSRPLRWPWPPLRTRMRAPLWRGSTSCGIGPVWPRSPSSLMPRHPRPFRFASPPSPPSPPALRAWPSRDSRRWPSPALRRASRFSMPGRHRPVPSSSSESSASSAAASAASAAMCLRAWKADLASCEAAASEAFASALLSLLERACSEEGFDPLAFALGPAVPRLADEAGGDGVGARRARHLRRIDSALLGGHGGIR